MSTKHAKAAAGFLENKKQAAWYDETLWLVRAKRDKQSKEVPEWEELREMACETKLYSNSHLKLMPVPMELMYIGRRMQMSIVILYIIFCISTV